MAPANTSWAQAVSLSDSLKKAFNQTPKLSARLGTRNSFITGRSVKVRSVKVGASFGENMIVGLGFNWLDNKSFRLAPRNIDSQIASKLNFQFIAPYIEYTFYENRNWFLTVPVQLGIGWSSIIDYDNNGIGQKDNTGLIVTYEPAMTLEYRFLKYFGVGAGVGYRLLLKNNKSIDYNFNSPVYILKFRVMFGKIYRDIIEE